MDWIACEAVWVFFPNAANVFVGRKTLQCLEPTAKVVGGNEVRQVAAQLAVGFVVVTLDRRFLEGAVHPLDLSIIRHDGRRRFHTLPIVGAMVRPSGLWGA